MRQALRSLVRMRASAVAAILTLTLGIGATTTLFSVVYAALLRPLPFPEPNRLVMLYVTRTTPRAGTVRGRWSYIEFTTLRSTASSFEDIAAYTAPTVAIGGNGEPEQIDAETTSSTYFRMLRVTPLLGRVFTPADDAIAGREPVALISERLWRRRFESRPEVVGQPILVNQIPLTIVGVLPEAFNGLSGRADLWFPLTMAPRLTYTEYLTTTQHFITVVARLKPVSIEQGRAELAALAPGIVVDDQRSAGEIVRWGTTILPLGDARVDPETRRSALLLLAAGGCVLLIACVNIAGVLLARAEGRRREIAIRMAIGSSRLRIVSQLMIESLLLAGAGGVCGTIAAAWGVHALPLPAIVSFAGTSYRQLSAFDRPAVDVGVLVFALVVTLLTSILFGLAPALEMSRTDLVTALKQGDRAAGGRRPLRALGVLVVGQVAVAVLLLEGAGLLLRSFAELQTVRRGFVARDVLTFWVSPPASRYRPEDGPAVIERLLASIQRVPGVAAAAANRCTPLAPSCARTIIFFPEHPADPAHAPVVGRHYVSEEYFGTLGIPIRAGRVLAERDRAGSPPVAVVNETAARRFWPGENPVGKHVWFGSSTGFTDPSRPVEIVGVVGDVKYGAADEAIGPDFYTSYRQFAYPDTMVMVKTSQDLSLVPALRRAVASVDPALPIYDVQMLDDRIAAALSRPRHNTALIATFAMTALLLAAVGVYGLVAYSVSFRHREIGIRLALGAAPRRVANIVLRDAARLAGLGAAIGVAGAMVAALVLRSILFHVAPYDPVVFLGTLLTIGFVAILAAYAPARRVSAVDPMIVLRAE